MSSTVELGLFGNENGLYPGKFFGDDGVYIEGQFVNDGEYCKLSFSGDMGTKIVGKNGDFSINGNSTARDMYVSSITSEKIHLFAKFGLIGDGSYTKSKNNLKVIEEGNYFGGQLNGNGKRVTTYIGDGKLIEEGNFVDGKLDGYGKTMLTHGDDYVETYVGEFKAGLPEGKGVLKEIDKSGLNTSRKLEGNFYRGFLNGFGKITDLSDGFVYTGDVKYGYPNGRGRIDFTDGDSVTGIFEDGVLKVEDGLFKHDFSEPIGWPENETQFYFNA